jgi:hypothetical protein
MKKLIEPVCDFLIEAIEDEFVCGPGVWSQLFANQETG